ncbi:MAG: ThiF family adenylyltransferase [Bacteroidetes bacterium]|nr:ThiF family adenylyltransferase [Bacteroidota bacterium]
MNIDDRTVKALGGDVMAKLKSLQFCIVGCGGTGATFAELLIRTGARNLVLVDGGKVNETNLNRVLTFGLSDCGKNKSGALKERLESIRTGLNISELPDSFRARENILPDNKLGQKVRDAVHDADIVFIGTDTNKSRLNIEELCLENGKRHYLSCGILVDQDRGLFEYECTWSPKTPTNRLEDEGYGPENASFASLVHEATSIAFTMLLNHLKCPNSEFKSYFRQYDSCLKPIKTLINGKSNGSIL